MKIQSYSGSLEVEDNCKLESMQVVATKRMSWWNEQDL